MSSDFPGDLLKFMNKSETKGKHSRSLAFIADALNLLCRAQTIKIV